MKQYKRGLFALVIDLLFQSVRFPRMAVMVFSLITALGGAYGNIISDGGFEEYYDYPTMYAHETARIKTVVDAGWDVGGTDKFRFP